MLRHISLKSRNLKKTASFYTEVLGLKVAFRVPPKRPAHLLQHEGYFAPIVFVPTPACCRAFRPASLVKSHGDRRRLRTDCRRAREDWLPRS